MFPSISLVWCQVVLVASTWLSLFLPYLTIFDKLSEILLGHFSLIHFQFLLSLVNYFSILLSVSSALSPDIFCRC